MTGEEIQDRLLRLLSDDERQVVVTKIAGYAIGAYERLPEDLQEYIKEAFEEYTKEPK